MKRLLSFILLSGLIAGSYINIKAEDIAANSTVTEETKTSYLSQSITSDYIEINNNIYVPFRWLVQQVGIKDFTWKQGKPNMGTKAHIEIEVPAYFTKRYIQNLGRGLDSDYDTSNSYLPNNFNNIKFNSYASSEFKKIDDVLNSRQIIIDITSNGYIDGIALYDYEIIDNTLYIGLGSNISEIFGLQSLNVDKSSNKIILTYISQGYLKQLLENEVIDLSLKLRAETAEDALKVWIRAQQMRSGALQYSILSTQLQESVLPEIKERGWTTGGSSPKLSDQVMIKQEQKVNDTTVIYTVSYESLLQGKVYERPEQKIEIKAYETPTGTYWKISNVTGDTGYYTYNNLSATSM